MNDQLWYVYQGGQQIWPFDTAKVVQMLHSKMIAQDAYLFKVGWKDWRPLEDGLEELGLGSPQSSPKPQRRVAAPRASVSGRVVVHNNGQLSIAHGVNISVTGIFVETQEQIFTVGERLKLSVRCDGMDKPFNVEAQVIRFNSDTRYPVGYGLQFIQLDPRIGDEIQRMVQMQQIQADEPQNVAQ